VSLTTLFCDDREPEEIISSLKKFNLVIEVKRLQSGDYVFGDVAIERKTVADLIGSVTSKNRHLWEQLDTMKRTYPQPILLVEGHLNWNDPWEAGIMTTVILFWKYQTIFSSGSYETATIIYRLFTKYGVGRSGKEPPAAVKKQKTPKSILIEMLQVVDRVGPKLANRIVEALMPLNEGLAVDIFKFDSILRGVKGLSKDSRLLIEETFKGCKVEDL
jgi:ERCC4-type nuclease